MNTKELTTKLQPILFCILILVVVFAFFYKSLFFGVKIYDEIIPFKETFLPTCFSISEISELVSLLGLRQHFEATNSFYSNISSIRCNPVGNLVQMLIQFLFKKDPFKYHLYSLVLHLINTTLIFFILDKASTIYSKNINKLPKLILISLLSLLWALHPVNLESVLLLTNANIVLSYTFAFITVFIYLNLFQKLILNNKVNLIQAIFTFFTFSMALYLAEFHFILPIILILYSVVITLNQTPGSITFIKSFISSIKLALPILVADFLFVILFLISNTGINIIRHPSIQLVLERIFWLSPQVLFHFLKLFLFPIKLSIDQTFFVYLGKTIFAPYAIFCICFMLAIAVLSIVSIIKTKQYFPFFFLMFSLFFISLIPFSQIIAPLYNLASERYLYFPSFIFIFGFAHFLFTFCGNSSWKIPAITILIILLCAYTTRAYLRTLDWKDNFTLYSAAVRNINNPLYKGFRLKGLTPQEKIFTRFPEREVNIEYKKQAYREFEKALDLLKSEKEKYELQTPEILKSYGLDPLTLYAKAGISLAQLDYTINNDEKRALKIILPYVEDLSVLDSTALAFYGALLYFNGLVDKAEEVLLLAHKLNPYSTRITLTLCDLIQIKYGDLPRMEKLTLEVFNYFPYDTFTLFVLTKIYELKKDPEKYAYFSYIYGLRHHSIKDLENAKNVYLLLNKPDKVQKITKEIQFLKEIFQRRGLET